MKKIVLCLLCTVYTFSINAQIDAGNLLGLPTATDLAEITGIAGPQIGALVYNLDDDEIYRFTSTGWQISTDDQIASEVNSDNPVDVDGDATTENTVEDVIQDIAPITSKAGRVFYPPSIQIDASTNGTFSINLYNEYVAQHTGAGIVRSETNGSPAPGGTAAPDIPIYNADELYYYVTFADPVVFDNIRIDGDTGEMTFDIVGRPTDFNSLINVVFVVK